jgi:hypothetical protein
MDDAWGKVKLGWAQGIDGKWKLRSDYDKAAKPEGMAKFANVEGDDPIYFAKKDYSDDKRKEMASAGTAMKDGSYPIADKGDLKDAVQAFGRAKNKPKTKAHIKRRAKALGAADAIPDHWKLADADLQKGLHDVGRLACLICDLEYLHECCDMEADREDDDSSVPDQIKTSIASLCAALKDMVAEETSELFDGEGDEEMYGETLEAMARTAGVDALAKVLADKSPKVLAKVGAKHSKGDQEHLNQAFSHVKALGAPFKKMYAAAPAEDLTKAGSRHSKETMGYLDTAHDALEKAGAMDSGDMLEAPAKPAPTKKAAEGDMEKLAAEKTALEKAIGEAVPLIKALQARVEKLESQPALRPIELARQNNGGAQTVTVVEKGADDPAMEERVQQMLKDDPSQIGLAFIKLAQRSPLKMGMNQ